MLQGRSPNSVTPNYLFRVFARPNDKSASRNLQSTNGPILRILPIRPISVPASNSTSISAINPPMPLR